MSVNGVRTSSVERVDVHRRGAFGSHCRDPPCRRRPGLQTNVERCVDEHGCITHDELMSLLLEPIVDAELINKSISNVNAYAGLSRSMKS